MTLTITSSKASTLAAELREELENTKAEEARLIEIIQDPRRKELPRYGLSDIRESLEILNLKHESAKAAADAELAKLPTAEEARKIITETVTDATEKRKRFYAAIDAAQEALAALDAAAKAHGASISQGINRLRRAGVPNTGAELDGEPISLKGHLDHGDTHLRHTAHPISYEWDQAAERYLTRKRK